MTLQEEEFIPIHKKKYYQPERDIREQILIINHLIEKVKEFVFHRLHQNIRLRPVAKLVANSE